MSISAALSSLMTDLHEPEPHSTQHSSSHSFLSFSYISYNSTSNRCKAPKMIVEVKPFEMLLWLPIVRYVDGVTNQLTNLISQNQNEVRNTIGLFMYVCMHVNVLYSLKVLERSFFEICALQCRFFLILTF